MPSISLIVVQANDRYRPAASAQPRSHEWPESALCSRLPRVPARVLLLNRQRASSLGHRNASLCPPLRAIHSDRQRTIPSAESRPSALNHRTKRVSSHYAFMHASAVSSGMLSALVSFRGFLPRTRIPLCRLLLIDTIWPVPARLALNSNSELHESFSLLSAFV